MSGKWIKFDDMSAAFPARATKSFHVRAIQNGALLGIVQWYAPWRRFAFVAYAGCVFEQDCLRDIATFCEEQTRMHKLARMRPDEVRAERAMPPL